ncbi:hypothetical protein JXA40_06405 [bacterium]|nr:hypothetical protein [candidate division CSSED10-310 bacterium]
MTQSKEHYWNIHTRNLNRQAAHEILLDFAAKRMHTDPQSRIRSSFRAAGISTPTGWLSLFPEERESVKALTVEISGGCGGPAVGLLINLPDDWRFFAASRGSICVDYHWVFPTRLRQIERDLVRMEAERLKSLGLKWPDRGPVDNGPVRTRLRISDPHVELRYREKLSGDEWDHLRPDLEPETPGVLSRLFPGCPAARFRNILGRLHLSVEQMAAEFTSYIEILHAFSRYDYWVARMKEQNDEETVFSIEV